MLTRTPLRGLASALIAGLAAALPSPPQTPLAPQPAWRKLVDTSATMPGLGVPFTGFSGAAVRGASVAFNGQNFLAGEGLYLHRAGQLSVVVDTSMDIPGHPGHPWVGFTSVTLDAAGVAFLGARSVPGLDYEGIWVWSGGALSKVVEKGDPAPGLPGFQFYFLFPPSFDAGEVVWNGYVISPGPDRRALWSSAGGVHALVDTATTIPGAGVPFADLSFNPTVAGGLTVFPGGAQVGDFDGVYAHDANLPPQQALSVVADRGTPVPGTNLPFQTFFDGVATRGGEVAFRAAGPQGPGLYSTVGGLHAVADLATTAPGSSLPFTGLAVWSLHAVSLNGLGDVAFLAQDPAGLTALYLEWRGGLRRLIGPGDAFDGGTVSWVDLGREGFDARRLAAVVGFSDGSAGVYLWRL